MIKFLDEYRDPTALRQALDAIQRLSDQLAQQQQRAHPWQIMEVCGGHTRAIYRFGLDQLLPDSIELIHGPGCPVCVLPQAVIDDAVTLTHQPGVILCCYGDVMRVPGSIEQGNGTSLQQARAQGADVRVIYSPRDALKLAERYPNKHVILFAIGFETTAPATALTLLAALKQQQVNFSVLCHHICIEPPLRALLDDPANRIDAFIGPGHVSSVIGSAPYQFIAEQYHKPLVISGFEPLDLLQSIYLLLKQLQSGQAKVENQYRRAVHHAGSLGAQQVMHQVFELEARTEWRGLGYLPRSGYRLRPAFEPFNAKHRLANSKCAQPEPADRCYCSNVLKGQRAPAECPHFGRDCTPQSPLGALMVSEEGACAAVWQFRNSSR